MALVTKTIGTSGDYSTISTWMANAPALGTDIWHGQLIDAKNYNEEVDLTTTGTASSTSYLWLDVDSSVRHDGVDGAGARISMHPSSSGRIIEVGTSWTRISGIELELTGADNSDECIRVGAQGDTIGDVLIEDCLVINSDTNTDQDNIYFTDGDYTASISNCIITGAQRGGIHYQNYSGGHRTGTINVDHCSLHDNGGDSDGSQLLNEADGASTTITWNVYNCAITDAANGTEPGMSSNVSPSGTIVWNGSHNLYETDPDVGTNNLTNKVAMTDGITDTTQTSGAYWVVEDSTTSPYDLRLLDGAAGNAAVDAGTDRQGSEPDTRQDFSTDAKGTARPTTDVDIGAFEFASANVNVTGGSDTVTETANAGSVVVVDGTVVGVSVSTTVTANAGAASSVQGAPPDTPTITVPSDGATVESPVNIQFTYSDPDGDPQARVSLKRSTTTIYP